MNRAVTSIITLLLLALPLVADDAKKSEKPAAKSETAAPAPQPTTLSEQPAAQQQDSPLVAAAKRTGRLGKKPTNVITNETVKSSGGNAHITTTKEQRALNMPPLPKAPRPTPEMVHAEKQQRLRLAEEQTAEKQRKAEEARQLRLARAAEAAEEEHPEDVDPAQAEKELRDAAAAAGQNEQKPPRD